MKEYVDFDVAKKMLPNKSNVHTFRQSGFMIIGADWTKKNILKKMKSGNIEMTGGMAKSMDHGLAVCDDRGYLFIETIKETSE